MLSKCSLARIYDTDMRSPSVSVRTLPQSPARALTCPIWKDMSFGSKDFSRRCATTSSIYDRFFDYLPRWSLSLWERRLYLRPGGETHIESVSEPAALVPVFSFRAGTLNIDLYMTVPGNVGNAAPPKIPGLDVCHYDILTRMRNIYKWLRCCKT